MRYCRPERIKDTLESAAQDSSVVCLLVLATKPCYIKLASLVKSLRSHRVPALIVDAGQHYEPVLTRAMQDFQYYDEIDVFLDIRGTLLGRTADLASKVETLATQLLKDGPNLRFVPIVSGDTSTSGVFPIFWYFQTGVRSIHVEAGLRSLSPFASDARISFEQLVEQRNAIWEYQADEPFPEQVDTRLTSVVSSILFAPVQRNVENLLRENYSIHNIIVSGSLSADAIDLSLADTQSDDWMMRYPALANGKWMRVDLHRRENMSPTRLNAVVDAMCALTGQGLQIIFVLTNQFKFALEKYPEFDWLGRLRRGGVVCQEMWPAYSDVVRFISSEHCNAIYTDSGGLQEEAAILGVSCITCRYSTDRPETVLDGNHNVLVPPQDTDLICKSIDWALSLSRSSSDRRLRVHPYGKNVADKIVNSLLSAKP